ncbi:MAG: DUF4331 domain-containing protein [Deltaproteobacteria bacterium]|nr:DUF4331 domain-containing protein [Deltaproteobacteria bacterium]
MLSLTLLVPLLSYGSSHREAPASALDPAADLTDVYAFISPEDPTKAVFIMNVNPVSGPGDGPNYHFFDDNVRYEMNIDNEGDGIADIVFRFQFDTTYQMPDTFLYNVGDITDPAMLNRIQTYSVGRWDDGVGTPILKDLTEGMVAPNNPGTQSDPTGGYDQYSPVPTAITSAHTFVSGDYRVFAGPRQEGFYIDLGRTFDLLNLVGLDPGDNVNTLLGFNASSIAIEVPLDELTRDGLTPTAGVNDVIAVWATTGRRATLNRSTLGADFDESSGGYVQVGRLGSPLVNEVVIPIMDKNTFNASMPPNDAQFLSYVTDPLLMVYINAILGVPDPGCYNAGFGVGCREDLVQVFLTGHPALATEPGGFVLGGPIPGEPGKVFAAFEALRMNLTSPLSGYPNGRAVGDDVVDTALSAVVGLLIDGSTLSDGVDSTGLTYLDSFPFLGDPWYGDNHPVNTHVF